MTVLGGGKKIFPLSNFKHLKYGLPHIDHRLNLRPLINQIDRPITIRHIYLTLPPLSSFNLHSGIKISLLTDLLDLKYCERARFDDPERVLLVVHEEAIPRYSLHSHALGVRDHGLLLGHARGVSLHG